MELRDWSSDVCSSDLPDRSNMSGRTKQDDRRESERDARIITCSLPEDTGISGRTRGGFGSAGRLREVTKWLREAPRASWKILSNFRSTGRLCEIGKGRWNAHGVAGCIKVHTLSLPALRRSPGAPRGSSDTIVGSRSNLCFADDTADKQERLGPRQQRKLRSNPSCIAIRSAKIGCRL